MKVRHKQTGEEFAYGFFHPDTKKWHVVTRQGEERIYISGVCEEIPTDEWVDVTEACEVFTEPHACRTPWGIQHREELANQRDYRLVKERLWRDLDGRMSQRPPARDGWCAQEVWAFRVERKS